MVETTEAFVGLVAGESSEEPLHAKFELFSIFLIHVQHLSELILHRFLNTTDSDGIC